MAKDMHTDYEFDATGQSLGRLASTVASILSGKNDPGSRKNLVPGVKVVIKNARHLAVSEKKKREKIYGRYTGYPGGLKHTSLSQMATRSGYSEVLRRAVRGMLPRNRLRVIKMKNLVISE